MTTAQQPDPFGAPPVAPETAPGPRAGFWIRVAAFFIDALVLLLLYPVLLAAAGRDGAAILLLLAAGAYFALLEGGRRGQSLGKTLCGIRVIDSRVGGPIGPGRALLRTIGLILGPTFLPLSFLVLLSCLWMLPDPEKQTWHDKLARAVIVPVKAYPLR